MKSQASSRVPAWTGAMFLAAVALAPQAGAATHVVDTVNGDAGSKARIQPMFVGTGADLTVNGVHTGTTASAGPEARTTSAPSTFTVAGDASYTLYRWTKDAAGNVPAVHGSPASVTVDDTPPSLQSFTRLNPVAQTTSADTLVFQATFSEPVQNVDATDFEVIGGSSATIASVTTSDSTVWDVTVSGGDLAGYNGGVALLLADSEDIADLADNPLPVSQPATDESYVESNARVCYVDGSVSGGANDGASWADAYVDLQSALHDTQCSQVWVATGVYKPGTSDPESTFSIRPGVAVYGGFLASETNIGQRVPAIDATVLSGDIGGDDSADQNGVDASYTDIKDVNSYNVVTLDGRGQFPTPTITTTTVLDGFTITGGDAEGSFPTHSGGGGLVCVAFSSGECSPTLSNLSFSGNNSGDVGGAIYALGAGATSSPNLYAVTFRGNHAVNDGGAVYFDGGVGGFSMPSVTNASFSGNQAGGNGGAIYDGGVSGNSSPQLTNVTFNANQAGGNGGAICNEAGGSGGVSAAVLKNVILWGDSAGAGPEIFDVAGASPSIDFSIVQGGDSGSNTGTAFSDGSNNIDADPLLNPLGDNGGYTRTLALASGSPAVSAGTNAGCPAADQRGVPRPQGPDCDMGAYELLNEIFRDGFEGPP